MTRTTDDLQDNEKWQPLGKATPKPADPPKPAPDARGPYGIVTVDGKLRTTKEPPR